MRSSGSSMCCYRCRCRKSKYLNILFAEMSALKCTHNGCTEGEGGARFKTPALPPQVAQEYLELHIAHGSQVIGAGRGANKARLAKVPSTKFQYSDDHIFHVERDIAKQYVTTKFKEDEEDEEVPAWTSPITSQAEGDGGDVRDGGDDRAAHDVGPGSNLQEMPHPVLRGECNQEEFQSFTQQWNLYARYHSGMDVRELRQQLVFCFCCCLQP